MDDYIDRQMAIEHYQHVCRRTNCKECPLHIQVTDTLTDCELELFLHKLPSADVQPIVRCGDCKHYDLAKNGVNGDCNRQYGTFYAYDFCSYGERRSDHG